MNYELQELKHQLKTPENNKSIKSTELSKSQDRKSIRGRQVVSFMIEEDQNSKYLKILEEYSIPYLRTLKVEIQFNLGAFYQALALEKISIQDMDLVTQHMDLDSVFESYLTLTNEKEKLIYSSKLYPFSNIKLMMFYLARNYIEKGQLMKISQIEKAMMEKQLSLIQCDEN